MPVHVYCCDTMVPDVKAALSGCSAGVRCSTFPGCCGRRSLTWEELRRQCGDAPAVVVGGECVGRLGPAPADLNRILLVQKEHCASLICGDYAFDTLTASGSYVITAGWLNRWEDVVKAWGFDGKSAPEFFAESCSRITLLETGSVPGAAPRLRELGAFVKRPVEVFPAGLELLTLQLEKALAEMERRQPQVAPIAAASDYALLLDMLSKTSGSDSEERVVDEMLAFFAMIFGAEELAFVPAAPEVEMRRHGARSVEERTLQELAARLDVPFHVEEAAKGFMVRLSHNGLLGWFWFGGFVTPRHLRSYLNLAVAAANVCAMAIDAARSVSRNIRESEERYRLLFENMGNGFALLELLPGAPGGAADFRFVEVNPAFEAFAGHEAKDLVGRTVLELLPGFDPEQLESLERLAREGAPLSFERYDIRGKCCQLWLFRPKPGYCGMIVNDTTKQKLLEDKLRESAKMESVGRLAGGVAHDYNNMLSVIIGYAEMLLLELKGNRRATDSLREICKAAEHSRDVTAQLLSFSRQQLISPRAVDLNDAVAGLAGKVSLMAGGATRVTFSFADDLWKVKVDPAQLEQLVGNVVRNAGAAMPGGGKLRIVTRNLTVGEEDCGGNADALPGDYVELSIADTGHGMDRETCRHVFEPFFTTRELGQGSGLGLATVYGMVTQNGGFVTVASEPGVGTTIRVCLPRFRERVVEAKAPAVEHGSGTVLVIEDDEIVGRMTVKMLEHMGYRVLMAESSARAVEVCREDGGPIDLVLSDVMLPGASGKEAVEEILALRPEAKIIYMSGYAVETLLDKGVDRNRVNFIQKPFDMATLNDIIKWALSGKVATA